MAVVAAGKLPSVATKPRRAREEEVLVWPDLVFAEFVAAVLFLFTLFVLSWVINAPLLDRANPDITPNPSKAPWYFLNLQELLLHMHPALAGVAVPTIALILLAVIPYVDRRNEGQGVWWGNKNSVRIAAVAAVYSVVVTVTLILFDKFVGTRRLQTDISWPDWTKSIWTPVPGISTGGLDFAHWNVFDPNANATNLHINLPAVVVEQLIPIFFLAVSPVILVWLVRPMGRSMRHTMIALFTGFMATWLTLTIVGTAFRGKAMELVPPWEVTTPE